MKIDKQTIIRIKSIVDAEVVLDRLGFDITKRGSKELRGPCKIHGGDNPTGFRFNLDTKTWTCYTRHCEGEDNQDLVGLVQKASGRSFVESVKFLAAIAGIDLDNQEQFYEVYAQAKYDSAIKKEVREHRSRLPQELNASLQEYLPEMIANRNSYFSDRGFPDEVLNFYEVGGWTDPYGVERATIPIRDDEGNLLTISGRRIDSDEDPKYFLIRNIKKGAVLYNLNVAKWYAGSPEGTLIIVEGFVDVWNLCMKGIYNAVAIMGTSMTPVQADLVSRYAQTAYILLDADAAGREGAPKVEKVLNKYSVTTKIIELPYGTDPKDLTDDQIQIYFKGVYRG